jgi:hypothetical protein
MTSSMVMSRPKYIDDHYKNYDTSGWCLQKADAYVMELHSNVYDVYVYIWGGAEQCPILTYYDDKYHGYEWGSYDWFFRNQKTDEWLYVPDLFPFQFANYGFAQGHGSKYRTDPVKLIKFFDMNPDANYSPIMKSAQYWFDWMSSSQVDNELISNKQKIYVDKNVTIYDSSDRYYVVVHNDIKDISITNYLKTEFKGIGLTLINRFTELDKQYRNSMVYSGTNISDYSFVLNHSKYKYNKSIFGS